MRTKSLQESVLGVTANRKPAQTSNYVNRERPNNERYRQVISVNGRACFLVLQRLSKAQQLPQTSCCTASSWCSV